MHNRLILSVAALFVFAISGSPQAKAENSWNLPFLTPSSRAMLADQQYLRDSVCIALADGQLDPKERFNILDDARTILKPDEYDVFVQALDRATPKKPPKKAATKPAVAMKAAEKSSVQVFLESTAKFITQKPPYVQNRPKSRPKKSPSLALSTPAKITRPD